MGHIRFAGRLAAMSCAGAISFLTIGLHAAHAQGIPAKAKPTAENTAKKKEEAQRLVASGIKSYESGKLDNAIEQLSAGMRAGGLPSQQMAKALYIRGLAYRKQGKPALAISDLTSAVWLKGGLSETERSDAMENRVAAYREAGLGDGVAVPKVRVNAGTPTAAAAPPTTTPAAATAAAPETKPSGWQTATIGSTASSSAAASPAPALGFASTEQSDAAPAGSSSSSPGIGTQITSFFGSMFGSTASSASTTQTPAASEVPAPIEQKVAAVNSASWGDATKVSPSAGRAPRATDVAPAVAVAPAPPVKQVAVQPAPAAVAPAAAEGKYKLQVAAVRSRPDAEAVSARLKKEHAFRLEGREPVIDEAVYGNMGTFYRVRVGPYADAAEPKQLCGAIKSGGFDCMVVTK